jgi:exodeoxyribonuclease V alpha subunit
MTNLSPLALEMIKTVARFVRRGHTYVPFPEFVKAVRSEHTDDELIDALYEALDGGFLVKTLLADGTSAVYQPTMFQMEKSAGKRLRRLAEMPIVKQIDVARWKPVLHQLSIKQTQAICGCLSSNIAVLTGGPGTGKTTTLKAVIDVAERSGMTIMLCAPTGQAAKRMAMASGREAITVHRMLGYNPETKEFAHHIDHTLPADLIVIDESSMLDLWLLHHLLRAVKDGTRLLFVGDVHQLPSVGAGHVLNDIIASGIGYVAHLTQIFRQGAGSCIVDNARAINCGMMPALDNKSDDFFMFNIRPDKIGKMIADIVAHRIPNSFGIPCEDIQVLSPMYKGNGGVDDINTRLQEQLNADSRWSIQHKNGLFKVGDRVIQTQNNYADHVMNGEVGQITFINKKKKTITILFNKQVAYSYAQMNQVKLAYAITIHRSQGSEYQAVVIPVTGSMSMLHRNLLYTAITRAKQLVVLVGSVTAIQQAIHDVSASKRWSALDSRINL